MTLMSEMLPFEQKTTLSTTVPCVILSRASSAYLAFSLSMIFGRREDLTISTAAGVVGAGFLSLGSSDCAIEAESGRGARINKASMTAVQNCRLIRCDLCFVDVVLRMGLPQSGDD